MKKYRFSNILIGVLFTLFFISLGVIVTVNFRPLYYFDINFLDIAENSGYTVEQIKENYDALIDYNSPFFKGELKFPSLPASNEGIQHFREVKNIFMGFYGIFIITLPLLILIILYKKRHKDFTYLKTSAITVLVLPAIVLLGCSINFDAAFVIFHKIFFRNDYWLFNPVTDPVIHILPDTFFLHAMLVIVFFVLGGSIGLYSSSKLRNRGRN